MSDTRTPTGYIFSDGKEICDGDGFWFPAALISSDHVVFYVCFDHELKRWCARSRDGTVVKLADHFKRAPKGGD